LAAYDAVASAAYDAVASELVSDVHLASDVHLVPDVTNVARKVRRYVEPQTRSTDLERLSETDAAPGILDGP